MLTEPFPALPHRPGTYQIRVFRDGDMKALLLFAAPYSAKKMCEACLEGHKWDYVGDVRLETEDGHIRIWSEKLHEIMEHKYTQEEEAWELPRPYPNYARMVTDGDWRPEGPIEEPSRHSRKAARNPADGSSPTPAKTKAPRASREGLVTIQDICAEVGVDPRDARAALRKAKLEKPSAGWAWSAGDAMIEQVKRVIKDANR